MGENHRYEIEPRPSELGGGWLLRLFEDADEVGRAIFSPDGDLYGAAPELAEQKAYDDALAEASEWLLSRSDI